MPCTINAKYLPKTLRRILNVALSCILVLHMATDSTMALSETTASVSVHCTAAKDVPDNTQKLLCADLRTALSAKFPDSRFSVVAASPDDATSSVTLETLAANAFGLDLRLTWQTPDQGKTQGPRHGFSVVDKTMTPAMQLQFLTSVVQGTALPF